MIVFCISLAVVCIAIGAISAMLVFKGMIAGYLHVVHDGSKDNPYSYMFMEVTKPSVESVIRKKYAILKIQHRGNISHE